MRPPEEVKRELVRQWLTKAERDLGLASYLLEKESPYVEAIGFHSQQAAEKFIKAYLVWRQVEFPKTHDLDKLLDLVASQDNRIAESLRDIGILTDYSVEIRYPGQAPEMSFEEARSAVELAAKARGAITNSLKKYLDQDKT